MFDLSHPATPLADAGLFDSPTPDSLAYGRGADSSDLLLDFIEDIFRIQTLRPSAIALRNRLLTQSAPLLRAPVLDRTDVEDFDFLFHLFLRALGPRPDLDSVLSRLETRIAQFYARALCA